MSRRKTRKQRLKERLQREADHKAFMRRGEIRREERAARDAAGKPAESPRERHQREQRERQAERIAARRAEHDLAEGKDWAVVDASVGRMNELCAKLRANHIPHFRAQDEIEQVLPSGRVRKLRVPLVARTVFVGVDSRDHLARLQETFPWLAERVPGQRYGRLDDEQHEEALRTRYDDVRVGDAVPVPAEEFPWHVDHVERTEGRDAEDRPVHIAALVPAKEMKRFADSLIGAAPILDTDDPIRVGETIRVVDGPFASFSGVVEEVDDSRQMLKAAVSIFGRATRVELGFKQIERL